MKRFLNCPSCNSSNLKDLFECKDHFLSHDDFSISCCNQCQLLITNPQPSLSELGQYYKSENYTSHKAEATSILDYVYILARKYTIASKLRIINRYQHNKTILDYGCGTGDFLLGCKEKGWTTTGFEPSDHARENALNKLEKDIHGNIDDLTKNHPYSIITLWHVLEHVNDLNETVANLRNLVTDNGKIIFALPNHESYDAKYYGQYWAAYDVPRHLYHFSKDSMKYLLSNSGLKLDNIIPMKLDSYYISLLSEKYKTGRTNYLKSILTGYKSNVYGYKTGNYSSLIYICSKC
ncbi:MAG: class I SAM-dependent methyltransferase [Cyclobacteriaceae bacterium]|nr:class I SAM-dependent methyltransferase [Cyclobacteriaceae bacterium]